MAKDPAFLMYSNDMLSGMEGLTMEERGQYITLLLLQHQKGHLSEKVIRLCLGNAAADVMAKFRQDPAGLWYNERLEREIEKRAAHGEKQRQRAVEGWQKRKNKAEIKPDESRGIKSGNAAALPLENVNEDVNVIEDSKEGVQGEPLSEPWFAKIFDDIYLDGLAMTFRNADLANELMIFKLKVRGSPDDYRHRDAGGIRQAFVYQLRTSKSANANGKQTATDKHTKHGAGLVEGFKRRHADAINGG